MAAGWHIKSIDVLTRKRWPAGLLRLKSLVAQAALLVRHRYKIPYRDLLVGWLHGFLGDRNIYYDFHRFPRRAFVSDTEQTRACRINGRSSYVLRNKLVFFHVVSGLGVETPRILAEGSPRGLVVFDGADSATDLESLIRAKKKVVIKPLLGAGGSGFNVAEWGGGTFLVNGSRVQKLPSFAEPYLVCEFVTQHEYAARLYPRTTNTIRLLTMFDDDSRKPFIAAASHRIGTAESFPVDNFGRGGLSVSIDLDTGTLGPATTFPRKGSLVWYDVHPETKERIAGVRVPRWESLKDQILSLAQKLAWIPYVGWDVVVTDRAFAVIEGNGAPGIVLQIHGPLLVDERVARFYERHGVIRKRPALEGALTGVAAAGAVVAEGSVGPARR
jgi:Sugar-transfer associated ATP-grasp